MLDNENKLARKVAIVTGAGRGIGRAIALSLGNEGAITVLVSRTLSELQETEAILRSRGRPTMAVIQDVRDWQGVQNLVARAHQEFGSVHILVNDAGIQGPIGPLVDNDPEAWVDSIKTNLIGVFFCCKAVLPVMMQQRYGKIINLSGGGATSARPYFSSYAAAKTAVVRLTETLAEEVKDYNIQVNAIAPGPVNTRMFEEILAAGDRAGEQSIQETKRQLESGGTPIELAAALTVFLASSASDGLTGKLVAALHDGWESWDSNRIQELCSAPWLTLRRMDPYTMKPFLRIIGGED